MSHKIGRILLTGAAGNLGRIIRPGLREQAKVLRLTDIAPLPEAPVEGEESTLCDLADRGALDTLLEGVDLIVHMGGASHEQRFDPLMRSNVLAVYNLYDAALAHGVRRVVYASSNHVTGYYESTECVTPGMAMRPDSLYATTKGFGELVGSFYWHRHGIETICLRIGSCTEQPKSQRALAAWLSHRDLCELVRCAIAAPAVGFAVVNGVSNNPVKWYDGDAAELIGYRPQDSAGEHAEEIAAKWPPLRSGHLLQRWQAGNILRQDYRLDGGIPPELENPV
ncbi:NAD-dependent epimerase/dehydratase family protein [Uliginosibacterium sp. sgz301328]|uniref:NAD-dependent epimerase/dehydratase family protein n=1 Tax=Uliginosibacterium sp. sgz301328 TaxID=3243764 RepID=UPI00359DAD27